MRYSRLIIWASFSLLIMIPLIASTAPTTAYTQSDFATCTQLVEAALETTNEVCDGTNRNQACYGHDMLSAEPQPGFGPFDFSQAGDRINVAHLNSLRLSPMDMDTGTWGVALLQVQADIPDEQPQNVSLLLFGDVQVDNLVQEPILMDAIVQSTGNANVRKEPDNTAFVMATLTEGTTVTARGRSEDNDWVYVDLPDQADVHGWVSATLLDLPEAIDTLNVVDPGFTQYGPMQAFYLETGANQTTCAEAPNDGLLVQTPEGVAEIRLWINEVKIRLGSTAFIQAHSGGSMTINTLEGAAHVEAFGVEQVAVAGTGVTVQLNQNSGAAAPPSKAQAYQAEQVQNLPTDELERPIVPVVETTPELTAPVSTSIPTVETVPDNTSVPVIVPSETSLPPENTSAPQTAEVTVEVPTNPPLVIESPTDEPPPDSPPSTVEVSGYVPSEEADESTPADEVTEASSGQGEPTSEVEPETTPA